MVCGGSDPGGDATGSARFVRADQRKEKRTKTTQRKRENTKQTSHTHTYIVILSLCAILVLLYLLFVTKGARASDAESDPHAISISRDKQRSDPHSTHTQTATQPEYHHCAMNTAPHHATIRLVECQANPHPVDTPNPPHSDSSIRLSSSKPTLTRIAMTIATLCMVCLLSSSSSSPFLAVSGGVVSSPPVPLDPHSSHPRDASSSLHSTDGGTIIEQQTPPIGEIVEKILEHHPDPSSVSSIFSSHDQAVLASHGHTKPAAPASLSQLLGDPTHTIPTHTNRPTNTGDIADGAIHASTKIQTIDRTSHTDHLPPPAQVYLPDDEELILEETFFTRGSDNPLPISIEQERQQGRLAQEAAAAAAAADHHRRLVEADIARQRYGQHTSVGADGSIGLSSTSVHAHGHAHTTRTEESHRNDGSPPHHQHQHTHQPYQHQHAYATRHTHGQTDDHGVHTRSHGAPHPSSDEDGRFYSHGSNPAGASSSSSSPLPSSRPLPPTWSWSDLPSIFGRLWFNLVEFDDWIEVGVGQFARAWTPHTNGMGRTTTATPPASASYGADAPTYKSPASQQVMSLSVKTQEIQIYLFLCGILCILLLTACIAIAWIKYQPMIRILEEYNRTQAQAAQTQAAQAHK